MKTSAKQTDRRVIRTKREILNALTELLEQKAKTTNNVVELNPNNEQSASELFNPNGTLNDNKVLEQPEGNTLRLVA